MPSNMTLLQSIRSAGNILARGAHGRELADAVSSATAPPEESCKALTHLDARRARLRFSAAALHMSRFSASTHGSWHFCRKLDLQADAGSRRASALVNGVPRQHAATKDLASSPPT